jgi:hypothetical protein
VSIERDESIDLAAARPVRLAGHDFHVAPLSLRQILAIADYVPKLSGIGMDNLSGERLAPLAEVLWQGLRRAHPRLTHASTLGGIESDASTAHQWVDSISTSGVPHQSQPATTDLSDVTAPTAWTATDGSGAGLTFAVNAETRYVKNGKVCIVSFVIQWPSTSDPNTAQINGIPAACTAHSGTYSWVSGGAALAGVGSISSGIAWVALQAGGTSLFFFGNANPLTNANMSNGTVRGTITYITN